MKVPRAQQLIESLRGDLAALQKAGAVGKVTMRQFDAICPPPVRAFSAVDIKRLRDLRRFASAAEYPAISGASLDETRDLPIISLSSSYGVVLAYQLPWVAAR